MVVSIGKPDIVCTTRIGHTVRPPLSLCYVNRKMSTPNDNNTDHRYLQRNQISQVKSTVLQHINHINNCYNLTVPPVQVEFDLKGRNAGSFELRNSTCRIRFNEIILVNNFQESLEQTVPHETAHYLTYKIFGRKNIKPHGPEWRKIMEMLGATADVYHNFDLKNVPIRQQRRHTYSCGCKQYELTTTRHNRVVRGSAIYHCRLCGNILRTTK